MKFFISFFLLLFSLGAATAQTNDRLAEVSAQITALDQKRTALEKARVVKLNNQQSAAAEEAQIAALTAELQPLFQERQKLRTALAKRKPMPPSAAAPGVAPAPAVEPKRIRILSTQASGFQKCDTDNGQMMISGLPASVIKHLADLKQLDTQIENLRIRHRNATRLAREADATAPTSSSGSPVYVNTQMAKRDRANLLAVEAENLGEDLAALEERRNQFAKTVANQTTIMAVETPQKYAGLSVWKCTGMAPPESVPDDR
jgi:hypothetical protein